MLIILAGILVPKDLVAEIGGFFVELPLFIASLELSKALIPLDMLFCP